MDFSFEFDGVRNALAPVRAISPMDGKHYFFGYYDLQPYSPDGRRHLAARIPFDMVLNGPDDVLEFGWIEDGKFEKLFETKCWNFQQGILATYRRAGGNVIFYNILDEEAGCYRTVRHSKDFKGGYNHYLARNDLKKWSYSQLLDTLSELRKDGCTYERAA